MALSTYIVRSIRPAPGTLLWGAGSGSANLFKMGVAGAQMVDLRGRADTASGGDARVIYARLHQYGAGGGEAVRAYAFANAAGVADGGTLNGLHASVSVAASSSISGAGNAARLTYEAAAQSRTLGGTVAALQLDSNIGAGNTVPNTHAFARVTDTGAVRINQLFNLPVANNGTLVATHITDAMTHSVRCVLADGTLVYLMATTDKTHRGGGA
ncbi:MAG TPA: hypothetical protein PKC99_12700 [Anaerolineales bacterium]|nr:hypothetical protein [Anaerolineales bacterium]